VNNKQEFTGSEYPGVLSLVLPRHTKLTQDSYIQGYNAQIHAFTDIASMAVNVPWFKS